jgi:4,5-dihydroxyphthalate decarboxylase
MLQDGEFDCAEVSLSSFLMAKDRGAPFTAIPVFPRRLFSPSQMYCNPATTVHGVRDLVGKRVGIQSYQTTLAVLAKGDLAHEYGVPLEQVTWVVQNEETIPFALPAGLRLERAPAGRGIGDLLAEGGVQAALLSRVPRAMVDGDPRVARLFPDPRAEDLAYFRRNGYCPIMHVVVCRDDVLARAPELAPALVDLFERAKAGARQNYGDPAWSMLLWGRHYVENEAEALGADPWPNGLARNRANLERFISYSHEQGLIARRLEPEQLFATTTLDT